MAATAPEAEAGSTTEIYEVRLPRLDGAQMKHTVMKFTGNAEANGDLRTCTSAKIERENNYREFKSANDIEQMPKSGAGSEYGREQRELARRKKFGMRIRKYNVTDQPWLLKMTTNKQIRKFRGIREGSVAANADYYIFTQAGNYFEAHHIDDWYTFTPQARYKCLNSEEAEDEFERRDKTVNYFSIMLKKRINNEDDGAKDPDDAESGKGKNKKKGGKDKSLTLSEFDEWGDNSDEDDNSNEDGGDDDEDKPKSKKKKLGGKASKKKTNNDDEALEESDEHDDAAEVDYMSGSSGDDEGMYDEPEKGEEESKYEVQGVNDEEGLKKFGNTDDEDEEDEDKKDDEMDEDEEGKTKDEKKDSDSDSSGSDSDSDIDKIDKLVFAGDKKSLEKKLSQSQEKSDGSSRPSTPSSAEPAAKKRKTDSATKKAVKTEPGTSGTTAGVSVDTNLEAVIKRYLQRKPMTTMELMQKIRKNRTSSLSKDQLVNAVAQILKKLGPDKSKIKDKQYYSLLKESP